MEMYGDDNISDDTSDIIIAGALREEIGDYLATPAYENMPEVVSVENGVSGDGNSISSPQDRLQRLYWCFTWNNYPDGWLEILETKFQAICKRWTFQKELSRSGTKHIQGAIGLKKKARWTEFKLPKTIHWEAMHNRDTAFDYCKKADTRDGVEFWEYPVAKKEKRQLKTLTKLLPWQETVAKMCMEEPDDREVNWIFDPIGNCGKTEFTKWMLAKQNCLANTGGNVNDIARMIAGAIESGFEINEITTFIFNLVRTQEHVNYKAIESIKDGLISSGKYESCTLLFNRPHMWIFSNKLPNFEALSGDRWRVWQVVENKLVEYDPDHRNLQNFLNRPLSNVNGFIPFTPEIPSENDEFQGGETKLDKLELDAYLDQIYSDLEELDI